MKVYSVYDKEFKKYGQVLEGYDFAEHIKKLEEVSEKPLDRVIYVPGDKALEALPIAKELRDNVYGGMPIQIGYCNGNNTKLNCLEYHRDSEVNIMADDAVLLVALRSDVDDDGLLDSSKVMAFFSPKGTAVEVYATAMHYAPCSADASVGFRVTIVLPLGTNTEKPQITVHNKEDELLTACNKWLMPHPDSAEAKGGAKVGIKGENIDIASLLPLKM